MTKPPTSEEWDFSALPPERRSYLETDPPFEEIAQRVADEAVCEFAKIELLRDTTDWASDGTWRVFFKVRSLSSASDLLYNGRDGLRGRYWQDPIAGAAATHHILGLLKGKLLQFAKSHPKSMVSEPPLVTAAEHLVERSLQSKSAKIWPNEKEDQDFNEGPTLIVRRWMIYQPGGNWRWAPANPLLDIKGAFFTPDEREYVPDRKLHRDFEIFNNGFS